ncbi:HPr kinase/phosphorylase [Sulfitobacter sp. JB4-11]|uniref:HPr kinase/phosphorylase n=1 Tax=Sulfitobacter rhodophyticola TaxID=3238304 RepID=UPI00351213A5
MSQTEQTLHATTVAQGGRAILILGPSGSGKSALALELISRGAALVSDDRTVVSVQDGQVIASAPPTIEGMIEARGIGILKLPCADPTPVALVVDLAQSETQRLPQARTHRILDRELRCLAQVDAPHFPAAILLCLAHGISEPT